MRPGVGVIASRWPQISIYGACGSRYRWDIDGSFSISPRFSRFLFSKIIYTFSIIRCFHSPEGARRRNGTKETRTTSVLLHPEEFSREIHRFPFVSVTKVNSLAERLKPKRKRDLNICKFFSKFYSRRFEKEKKKFVKFIPFFPFPIPLKIHRPLFKFLFEIALSNTSSLTFPPFSPKKKKKKVGRFEGIHWPRSASVIDFRSVIKPFREDSKWHCAKNSPSGRRSTTLPPSSQQHRLSLSANYFSPLSKNFIPTLFLPPPCSFSEYHREKIRLSLSPSWSLDRHGRGYRSIIRPSVLFIPLPAIEIAASPKGALLSPPLPLFHRVHLSKELVFVENPWKTVGPSPQPFDRLSSASLEAGFLLCSPCQLLERNSAVSL